MTSLTLIRRIKARPSIVFEAVMTADGIAQWWRPDAGPVLMAETDPRKGGRFRVRFRMPDGRSYLRGGQPTTPFMRTFARNNSGKSFSFIILP
jgi:uncharacterized protein YndB with AHSA1/START domain